MAIKILEAWTQRGWSNCDHLIDNSRIEGIVGRTYRSYPLALRAAERLADVRGYAAIRYLDTDTGEIWVRGAEPPMPGRSPLVRYEGQQTR